MRLRTQISKLNEFSSQLKSLSLKVGYVVSINEVSTAIEDTQRIMGLVSSTMDPKKLGHVAKTLSREDAKLDMKSDMISDVLNNIGEGMDDPVEQEKIYQDILKDVGIQVEDSVR